MIIYGPWWRLQNSLVLNSDIQGSFKKFLLLFRQSKMIFVIVWFLDHFTLKLVPSMNGIWIIAFVNGIWIIAFVSHLHVWVTKSKPSLCFSSFLYWHWITWYEWTSPLFFLMKHSTFSKHRQQATCLCATSSLISSLSLKIFCWCSLFLNLRACIWLSFSLMAEANFRAFHGKTVSTTYSMKGTALGFLQRKRKQ